MKIGWQTKRLDEVCQIKPPKSEARDRVSANKEVSFLPMEGLGINRKFVQASQTKQLSAVVGSYTYFADGDVLLAKITPCFENGKLGIAEGLTNGIGFGSSEYIVFRPDETLNKEWLYYYLSREVFRDEGAARMSGAVGHKRVAKEFIETYTIPLPPLPEQQRIIGILGVAFDGIATAKVNAEKNLQNARALFESHLQSVFTQRGEGWVEKRLGELYSFKNGINFDKTQKIDRGILTIDVLNMYGDDLKVGLDRLYRINKEVTGEYILKDDDILVVRSSVKREGVGWAKVFRAANEPITFCGFIIRGRPLANILSEYTVYFLRCQQTRDELIQRATQSTITNINQFNLGEIVVPIPSLVEQKQIISKLDSLRAETQRLESIYEQKLAALDALKKSLLDQAFTGQL